MGEGSQNRIKISSVWEKTILKSKKGRLTNMKKTIILLLTLVLTAALFTGCAQTTEEAKISRLDAVNAVYASVGIDEADALYTVVTESEEKNLPCYEVEISVDGVIYRYRVDSAKGDFLKVTVNDQEVKPEKVPKPDRGENKTKYIGIKRATAIALRDASLSEGDLVSFEYEMDFALGQYLYDLEFKTASHEYEYEIDALTGEIFKKDVDGVTVLTPSPEGDGEYIGITAAEDAALLHAGVQRDESVFEATEWKMRKGVAVYKIEFVSAGVEYEYTVNALTGAVISHKREGKSTDAAEGYIGEESAKAAALAHAGLTAEEVVFKPIEVKVKNGKTVYEVEFECASREYEYKIDAVTGDVLKAARERK